MTASDVDLVRVPGLDSAEKDAATVASANTSNSFEDERITSNEFSSEISKSSVGVLNSGVNRGAPSSSSGTSWRTKAKSDEFEIMPRSSNIPTNNSMLSELTINKFNIKSMGLVGREREIKVLKSCYGQMIKEEKERAPYDQSISEHLMLEEKQRTPYDQSIYAQSLIHSTLHKELVFISGYSGVGKSSLAKTLEKEIAKTTTGIYVEGKFHLNASDEPYSGIVSAFGEMCKRILKRQSQPRKNAKQDDDSLSFGSRLSATLGPAGSVLSDFISELQDILPHTRRNSDDSDSERCDFDVVKKRVKHAFRLLMRALNAEFSPIVLVLDDLHWADDSSLEVIDFLISDLQNPTALMIVGCYRSNEVDNESLLLKQIQALRKKQDKFNFHTTDIEVESCDIDSVNKMIMAMMSIDDEELTRGLAEVCYKRTAGNPFFLIEFMQMLQEHSLISYNLGLLKWIWDEDRIATATVSAENVVDLLKVRMRKLPANVQLFLQYDFL